MRTFSSICGSKFCSMKITQEVRDCAARQNQNVDAFIAAAALAESEAENGNGGDEQALCKQRPEALSTDLI